MHFWEELEDCKFNDNEYLVDHLVEVIKDENINSLEELQAYEDKYFIDSNMSREQWIKYYEESFNNMPEIDAMLNDATAMEIRKLREEITNTLDNNLKIRNIIMVCALMEREFCFLVEAYNLIMDGKVVPVYQDSNIVNNEMINIVLCCSMKVKEEMYRVYNELVRMRYNVLLPEECIRGEIKEIASRAHFDRIANPNNQIILVVNATKNGIENYIGPNSFAEIAFGFYYRKKVLLLNDVYEQYKDELLGWGVKTLQGDLNRIKSI